MPTEICRHIRTTGTRCGSVALRNNPLCYFHDRMNRLHGTPEPPTILPDRSQPDPLLAQYFGHRALNLPPLEDHESIQIALSLIVTAMGQGRIDLKLATSMIYGLRIASINAVRLNLAPNRATIVRDIVTAEDGRQLALDEDPAGPEESILQKLLREIKPQPDLVPQST